MVVTNSKKLVEKMDIFRANGTNRTAFLDHRVSLYTWVGVGSSFLMSDILAALLIPQMKKLNEITRKRTMIAQRYTRALRGLPHIVLPTVPRGAKPNWHIYAIRFEKPLQTHAFMSYMKAHGITAVRHYVPLHASPMGKKISGKQFHRLPVVEMVAETLVRLPLYPGLSMTQQTKILHTAKKALSVIG